MNAQQSNAEAEAVERHRHNISKLGPRDVPIAGYPGSGASLLGNILLELGFDYVDPYSEVIIGNGGTSVVSDWALYRARLPATAARDRGAAAGRRDAPRFFKNHLYPREYQGVPVGGAVILVRDPRDAVYSSYQWFRGFSRHWMPDAPKGQGTFAEFLDGTGINDEPPIAHWAAFYQAWLDALDGFPRSTVVRFEDLKADPAGTTTRFLDGFGLTVDDAEVRRAVERSSFESMRAHEDRVAGSAPGDPDQQPRINRRGKVGEWRDWYGDPDLARRFQEPALVDAARRFGYHLTPSP